MPDLSALNGASSSSARPYTEADYENATRLHRSQSLSEGGFGLSSGLRDVRNARGAGLEYTPPAAPCSSAAGMANGTFSASSVSAARTVTAPNASTEEIEMSMKAFARELILAHGGARALNASRQLTLLLEGTEPNSATQKYLRKFMYALHMLNVTSMYDSQDAAHMSKRNTMVNAFIDAIDAASKYHVKQPGKSDEVFAGKLDHNSSTGKPSYKGWSRAWTALNEALSQRSTGASDMRHLEAYYAQHVMPRTQLRAQFVYGETTDKAEERLHSGSKQAVWDASRQLLCCNAVNAEERGLNLAAASELLHMMPEFLRRPKNNQDATNTARNEVTDHQRPENQITDNQSTEAHRDPAGEVPSDRCGSTPQYAAPPDLRDLVLLNRNGAQTMNGHTFNLCPGSDANRNAGVSTSGHRPGGEPEAAPGNDAAGGLAGGNADTDDTQRVSTGHRSRRGSSANEVETPVAGPDELAGQPAATTSPLVETHSALPAPLDSTRGATEVNGMPPMSWSASPTSSPHDAMPTPSRSASPHTPRFRFDVPQHPEVVLTAGPGQRNPVDTAGARQSFSPTPSEVNGTPPMSPSVSSTSSPHDAVPTPSRSASPDTPRFRFDVPQQPQVVLTAGPGQRNPVDTARARQSFSSPTPDEVE
ncbi:hypothetical protein QT199_015545 [Xanthomonas phaseoli pv. phaseoli]|uniref:Uncharacterized protein n=3 Tax=Xanthomonas TaxID=338 RepID=A0AB38DTW6_XANCH|nr:hypothetical protein [Xanthomonas phaseoli]ATS23136.2 hypothetical protein XppCFBP412P_18270 [Xanthomonas phaseoli pv. phaseoli]ATS26033.2 hypothetical protein XppCFBP6164P_11210 [Xanthomonas phaseoli pv. phaseoli]ATS30473.2 hypothetical protein XppCFBP6546P_12480 [Xanthomonas phaseoli pv. phaseoli]ATS34292.2 hypothetical protein XppCFBP6982P_10675 [Xanthomonas phaseoli pv. phaseoli]MBO9737119.1 hypothetical protein [Xanthomonas phaseoli pv. phaseoli]